MTQRHEQALQKIIFPTGLDAQSGYILPEWYDTMSTSTNETEEKIIGDDLMTMERTRLAAMPEQRRLIYTLNRFENKTSPEIANELNLSCRTVENHLFLGRREMREFFRNCI